MSFQRSPRASRTAAVLALAGLATTATAPLTAHAQSGHGMATVYPPAAALPGQPPYTGDAEPVMPVDGFGRLFARNASIDPADPLQGSLRAHPSPRYDLVRLGREMFSEDSDAADGELPVGYVFFGQFIDHDLTLDVVSGFNRLIRADEFANTRTVDLDLDNVYGDGPEATPFLYNLPYLRLGAALVVRDGEVVRRDVLRLPMAGGGAEAGGAPTALIGDPRNDENFAIAQMQAAFIAFHNRVVDLLLAEEYPDTEVSALSDGERLELFEAARDHVVHYYHRIVMEDYLPRIIGIERLRQMVVTGRDFYFPDGFRTRDGRLREPFIPIEFAVAGFRFGHSQVPDRYTLRANAERPVIASLFADPAAAPGVLNPRGFTPIRFGDGNLVFEWHRLVDIGGPWDQLQVAQKIDPRLENVLSRLHEVGVVRGDDEGNLASRNLNRSRTFQLPSGQALAVKVLLQLEAKGVLDRIYVAGDDTVATCPDAPAAVAPFCLAADATTEATLGIASTPLWYYILQEASHFGCPLTGCARGGDDASDGPDAAQTRGMTVQAAVTPAGGFVLGPVGSAVVGETLYGLVDHYREATGNGLDFQPGLAPNRLVPFDTTLADVAAAAAAAEPGLSETSVRIAGADFGRRYMLRNLLIDAGLHHSFVVAGTVVCDAGPATAVDAPCTSAR